MRTMSGSPCLHYDCSNRNSFGYCKTTVCINEHYQREQWGLPSTLNKSESVVIKQQTNADRIRAMTDEELANLINRIEPKFCHDGWDYMIGCDEDKDCVMCWLDWLRQEVDDERTGI